MENKQVKCANQTMSLKLPLVVAGRETKKSLEQKFFRGGEILAEYLQEIEDILLQKKALVETVYQQIVLGLFLKLNRSYRSFLLLLHNNDPKTIQFLSEQLCEAVVMLVFLAEEIDETSLGPYLVVSLNQAYHLYTLVKNKLLQSPQDEELQTLKAKLHDFIERSQQQLQKQTHTGQTTENNANERNRDIFDGTTLDERVERVGIEALLDSSGKITVAVQPASLLDLELFYLASPTVLYHFLKRKHWLR